MGRLACEGLTGSRPEWFYAQEFCELIRVRTEQRCKESRVRLSSAGIRDPPQLVQPLDPVAEPSISVALEGASANSATVGATEQQQSAQSAKDTAHA